MVRGWALGFRYIMMILGKKLNMTQIWKDETVIPVTVISVPPNTVSIIRTKAKDGYDAVQLQLGRTKREAKLSLAKRDDMGDLKKGDTEIGRAHV